MTRFIVKDRDILHTTAKAVKVRIRNRYIWLPKEWVLMMMQDVSSIAIFIPDWLRKEKDL